MIKIPVSRFSIPIWAPLLLFLSGSFLIVTHTSLITDSLQQTPPPPPFPQPVDFDYGRLARRVSATDLMNRPLARNSSTIPKIYHQSWMSSELPTKFQHWTNLCRSLHADWEWVLWTDEDNENLVRKHFPWLLESYHALPAEIYRADFSRTLYMYAFGGVYNDLDTECLRPSETALDKYFPSRGIRPSQQASHKAFFGRMGDDPEFEHSIPNAWMAATPGHPFFLVHMEAVDRRVKKGNIKGINPEAITGPITLRDAIVDYEVGKVKHGNSISQKVDDIKKLGPYPESDPRDHEVNLLPSEIVYPYSWNSDGKPVRNVCWVLKNSFNPEECKRQLQVREKGSISITYWSHTHTKTGQNSKSMKHVDKI